MDLYIVVKKGVYYQDVFGPFGLKSAVLFARRQADSEPDQWHTFYVYPAPGEEGVGELWLNDREVVGFELKDGKDHTEYY